MPQDAPRSGRGRASGEDRRAQILRAAATVFARRGYHRARMDDIVAESGLSKGSLYWYFTSKEELATALVRQTLAVHERGLAESVAETGLPPMARAERVTRRFARAVAEPREHAPLSLELLALAQHVPDIKRHYSEYHARYLDQIAILLREARPENPAPEEQVAHTALAIACIVDGMLLRWVLAPEPFVLEDELRAAVATVVRGYLAPQVPPSPPS